MTDYIRSMAFTGDRSKSIGPFDEPPTNPPTHDAVTVELLPCPFCGGEATTGSFETESLWSHNQVTYTTVDCGHCNIQFASEPGFELEAPAAWNRRVPTTTAGSLTSEDVALERAIVAVMAARRYVFEEDKHGKRLKAGKPTSRDALDLALADMMTIASVADFDVALARLASTPTDAAPAGDAMEALRKLTPDGYWNEDDREYGHNDLADLLCDADDDVVYAIVPWKDLPTIYAVYVPVSEDDGEWETFPTEEAARAALAVSRPTRGDGV